MNYSHQLITFLFLSQIRRLHISNIQYRLSENNVLYAVCKLLTPYNLP